MQVHFQADIARSSNLSSQPKICRELEAKLAFEDAVVPLHYHSVPLGKRYMHGVTWGGICREEGIHEQGTILLVSHIVRTHMYYIVTEPHEGHLTACEVVTLAYSGKTSVRTMREGDPGHTLLLTQPGLHYLGSLRKSSRFQGNHQPELQNEGPRLCPVRGRHSRRT